MKQLVYVLLGWVLTATSSWCAGMLLVRRSSIPLYRQEETPLAFVVGSACVSTVVFFLAALHLVYRGVFLALAVLLVATAIQQRVWRTRGESLPALPPVWRLLFLEIYLPFAGLYLIYALAPEASPDGSTYHLGLVARYAREHGFAAITTNMYASLSQGMEMLFLYAFVFGRHSAAALAHFTFLLALPLVVLNYGRRIGMPLVGVAGGLLIFLAPIAGISGTTAYNDVALTTTVFSLFVLLQIWALHRQTALLILIGLVAGFAFDIKYTAFVAVPYALAFIAYKCRRSRTPILHPLLLTASAAAVLILPTLVKNSIVVHNPVAPFFNRLFPNPYVHVAFEDRYREHQRTYHAIQSAGEIPWQLTVAGEKLQGLLGPAFLLAPLALFALRYEAGRQLLLAALVFFLPYPSNIGTRFFLPCAAFLAPAMALGLSSWTVVPVLVVLLHAWLSWPTNVRSYCDKYAYRLDHTWVRSSLRLEPEDEYLIRHLEGYVIARQVEKATPPGSRIFSFDSGLPEAYCAREILVSFQAGLNERLHQTLYAGFEPIFQPLTVLTFRIRPDRFRRLRVVQTASAASGIPGISEVEIFGPGGRLPRKSVWRFHADPFPWDAELAFDGNPATQWKAWETIKPGMFVEVDLGSEEVITSVQLDVTPDQGYVHWQLEGETPTGRWTVLNTFPQSAVLQTMDLRKAAMQELKHNGIGYILVPDSEIAAADFRNNSPLWSIHLLVEHGGIRLYQAE
jgi:hypothetical protein